MIERELTRWADQVPDHPLDNLMENVWAGVRAAKARRATVALLMAGQAAVMILALAGAAGGGALAVRQAEARRPFLALAGDLAPSTLLMGERAWAR